MRRSRRMLLGAVLAMGAIFGSLGVTGHIISSSASHSMHFAGNSLPPAPSPLAMTQTP